MTTAGERMPPDRPDPEAWIERHGDALFRFACLHLGDRAAAEDAVQEALLAGLESWSSFAGRSSERTWLIGILKRKVIDHIRKQSRGPTEVDQELEQTVEFVREQFDEHGLWAQGPARWGRRPSQGMETREFWDVLLGCLEALPPRLRYAFSLRELEATSSEEICKVLGVSATNLWTLLHRARTRLRQCLESNWFS